MDLATRAIVMSPPPGADRDAMSVIQWDTGANSHRRTDFIRDLSIRPRAPTDVSDCTVKPRRNFSPSLKLALRSTLPLHSRKMRLLVRKYSLSTTPRRPIRVRA